MKQGSRESGRSMIELVGVLAVMGLITAGAFVLIRSGMASQKRSRVADEVAVIAANVRSLSAEKENFDNLSAKPTTWANTNATAKLAGAMLGATAAVATPLSSSSYYAVAKTNCGSGGTNCTKFVVALVGIPANDCTVLASATWGGNGTASCPTNPGTTLEITYGKD